VNVANFGLKRIIVYEGDTVDSLVADFVKLCPIDEPMVERLKELLKKQMDGVLERIDEDDDNHEEEDEGTFSIKDGNMMDPNQAEWQSDEQPPKSREKSPLPNQEQPVSASETDFNALKSQAEEDAVSGDGKKE
jgi:hypothetical protein